MTMTFGRSIFFAFVFLMGLLVGVVWHPVQPINKIAQELPAETKAKVSSISIPELVAGQLRNGELNCPASDPLNYEACLLFQGALGVWKFSGMKDECPILKGDKKIQVSKTSTLSKNSKQAQAAKTLTPEDALRATASPCFGYIYAISVANATPVLIGVPKKLFNIASGKSFSEPGSDPELCFKERFGFCGNQAAVAMALFHKAGFEARSVQFFYEQNGLRRSHVIPEVFVNGKWRPVDTTYGSFWMKNIPNIPFELASTDEVLSSKIDQSIKRFDNNALLPHVLYAVVASQNAFSYLAQSPFGYLDGTASILRGGVGTIKLSLPKPKGTELLEHKPNYIGDNVMDGRNEGISYQLVSEEGEYHIQLNVSAAVGDEQDMKICIDANCLNYSKEIKSYKFSVVNPKLVYLKTEQDVAYVVLSSIEWNKIK